MNLIGPGRIQFSVRSRSRATAVLAFSLAPAVDDRPAVRAGSFRLDPYLAGQMEEFALFVDPFFGLGRDPRHDHVLLSFNLNSFGEGRNP